MERVGLVEALGVRPVGERLRQAMVALRGEEDVPPSRYDLSSLGQLRPRLGVPLWRRQAPVARRVLVTNLFNHEQSPVEEGWSVRQTRMRDFRGATLTYDSHNGTDFAIPIGTPVLTAAEGVVVRVVAEFNRGGLKVFVDHGAGLMTCYAHLARSLVEVGDRVRRGQPVALSGYSGLDGLITFPWGTPHVHFNVWLGGEPVDPFPHGRQPSMWRAGHLPVPPPADAAPEAFAPSVYDPTAVDVAIATCLTASSRARLSAIRPLDLRAAELIAEMNYYPTRFPDRLSVYAEPSERDARLDLPFPAGLFDGITFADDL